MFGASNPVNLGSMYVGGVARGTLEGAGEELPSGDPRTVHALPTASEL